VVPDLLPEALDPLGRRGPRERYRLRTSQGVTSRGVIERTRFWLSGEASGSARPARHQLDEAFTIARKLEGAQVRGTARDPTRGAMG